VICGSAAGTKSAKEGHYYAGRGNKFWRTLATVALTTFELRPADYARLLEFGIGLTDLVKHQAGSDRAIRFQNADAERLATKIRRYAPRFLCFNGKRAAQEFFGGQVEYGLQVARIGTTHVFVAPSTSAAANRSWDISHWQEIARLVGRAEAAV